MGLSPLVFTGVSKYSDDFQTILSRSSTIANLPVKALQNQQSDTVQKKLEATTLQDAVKALSDSLTNLASIGDHQAITASSSDASKVTIVSASATAPATFTVSDISSVAKAASETSVTGYADSQNSAVSATGNMSITAGGQTVKFSLTPTQNNLVGLRDEINSLGLGVTASILTTGTGATPNYLSVTSNTTGQTTLAVTDDPDGTPSAWLSAANQGSNAVFKLNGVAVSKSSNLINDVAPGVTFNIAGTTTTGETATISLTSDRSKLESALSDFVDKFNAVSKQVDGQIGAGAGVLSGDFVVREAQTDLRKLSAFQGSGLVKSFADLGLEMSTTGELSFNHQTFAALTDSQLTSAFQLVGSSTSGFGSLQGNLAQMSDPISGLIQIQINQYDQTDHRLTNQISDLTTRNAQSQAALSEKLQQADTLLAQLESQQTVLDASLKSVTLALFGKSSA